MDTHRRELVVVGGGLVGSSLALALAGAGRAVTLVESRAAGQALADPLQERYLALSASSINALSALGVWPGISPQAEPIRAVHASRAGTFGRVLLRASEHGREDFGAVVPASVLGVALEAALARCPQVERLRPARLEDFRQDAAGIRATVATDAGRHALEAGVLVAADGADSPVRTALAVPVELDDYGQHAIVASVGLGRGHEGVAYERFTADGAIAALPLPGRRAGLVLTLPSAHAATLVDGGPTVLVAALQERFGHRLGRLHSPGRVSAWPLLRRYARQLHQGRVVLVGNAAQSLHPIAAQGFNLGLRDALVLAECLDAHAEPTTALAVHAARREPDRSRIAGLSHALARWPKLSVPGGSAVASLALAAFNLLPPLRDSLALAAMGFADDAPALALAPVPVS
ncbi:MAG: FAD-dependent monooxygenase [Xanthomonadales bacterium]|nr:FAD-dependent monooxygenase [Xanthomonadales bacterium]